MAGERVFKRVFKAHVQVRAYDPADELLQRAWGLPAEAGGSRGEPLRLRGPAPGKHTGLEPDRYVRQIHAPERLGLGEEWLGAVCSSS